ncbi:MAG: hypothetical protein E7Z68_01125 [Thermoplasmata archaeon]|nr:hypothetical protein [Thermoplasmata archaeon]
MTSTTSYGALNSLGKLFFEGVLEGVRKIRRRTCNGGDWPFDPNELIRDLVAGRMTLDDPYLQAVLLDWIESEDRNVFLNQDTGEFVYALSAKRGNKVYATRKSKRRNEIEAALDGKEFDVPVKGFRNRRYTRLLLTTVNFDREQYAAEEAWAALRSTPTEGAEYEYNVLNNLNANISKIFGKHGTLVSKEAQSSGYPAPHLIFLLDEPVMVERHSGRGEKESWRICDPRILDRIGKGPLMRRLCRTDHRKAIRMNPIWKHGFIDFEGIVKGNGSRSGKDTVSYAFKYLVKCLTENGKSAIKDLPDISSVKDKGLRTMLFTHLGNKCFRTRDVSFGKGFKDRIGLLPEPKSEEKSPWKLVKTITEQEFNLIQACIRLGLVDNTPNS